MLFNLLLPLVYQTAGKIKPGFAVRVSGGASTNSVEVSLLNAFVFVHHHFNPSQAQAALQLYYTSQFSSII